MPRQADHIEQPGAPVADQKDSAAAEAPKSDSLTDYASGMGNQEFSNTVARTPAEADVAPGENEPGGNEAQEAETQDVAPGEGAESAEPAAAGAAPAGGESEGAEGEQEQPGG